METVAEREPPFSKHPNWWLFYTGGIITAGGLGWCLRFAIMEHPKQAAISYLVGSAGVCLMNVAVIKKPGRAPGIPVSNWMMLVTGGIISGSGFGYFLSIVAKENRTSAAIGYAIGTLGYIMANSVLYTMTEIVETEMSRKKRIADEKIMKQVYKMIESTRFNFKNNNNQCVDCEAIKKKNRERKETAKPKVMNIVTRAGGGLWNLMKFGLCMGRASQAGVEREMYFPVIDKNKVQPHHTGKIEKYENKNSNGNQMLEDGNEAYSGGSTKIVHDTDYETSIKRKTNYDLISDLIGDEEEEYCGPTNFPFLFSDMSTLTVNKLIDTQAEEGTDESADSQSESESDTEAELSEQ